jgi:small-conductance mechanosensitive channel
MRAEVTRWLRQGRWLVLFASALTLASLARAEEPALEGMEVRVANRPIITLRGPIAGHSASERVASTLQRIEDVLERTRSPEVSLEETPDGTLVLLGGKPGFLVTRVDIEASIGETTTVVAREAGKRLRVAIEQRRLQETPRYLGLATAYACGALLLYGCLVWLLVQMHGWVARRASYAVLAQARRLRVAGVPLLTNHSLSVLARRLIKTVVWSIGGAATVACLSFILLQFPYTRPWGEQVQGKLLEIAQEVALAIVGALPGMLFVGVICLAARAVIRVAALLFDRIEQGSMQLEWLSMDTVRPTRRIFSIVVFVFALAMAYPYLPGAGTEAFKGLSVLVGVMVSLGGSSLVGQAANGLTLMYSHSFRRGDYVRIGEAEGTVMEIGMFATRVRTGLGEEIMLPSSTVMATTTKNYSRVVPGTGYVVDTVLTIGYSTPWRQVHAMLEEAARRTPGVAQEPPPMVRQTALSDFYIEYRLAAYTPAERPRARAEVLNDLHAHIQDVFNEFGVQIMSPHYMTDPAEPQTVPKRNWYASPAHRPASDVTVSEGLGRHAQELGEAREPSNGGTPPVGSRPAH